MERNIESTSIAAAINMQNSLIQVQENRFPSIKVQESTAHNETATVARQFSQRLFRVLFLAQLILTAILVIFLTIRGLLSSHSHHFHPKKWYPPLLSATGSAGIVAFTWQWITFRYPSRALKAAFWFSPLLTCAVGILLVLIGSAASLALGSVAVVFAVIQSLYSCWVNPRFDYAIKVLSVSTAFPPSRNTKLVIVAIFTSIFYSSFLVSGIGGATITGTEIDIFFILVILLSLTWTMQVIRNALQVTVARIKYIHFSCGADMDTRVALRDTVKHLMGSISIGSALVPILAVIWGSARAIKRVAGGTDEFLFSCANCYSAIASTLVTYGNRWGFVQVGVYNKGFVQASMDTWEMFSNRGLEPLIDSDLTGSFCFLSGIAGGAVCTLVGGIWTLAVHKSYATEVSIYAFLIGYFMCRIAMAWPQACVSAYYVVYAENPQSLRFDPTIPVRIQELQRYGA
ncbi:protein PNS1 [Ricinus communis]|uniref:Choline transporter-like protein n=1 Tax=Ricinus communis TaxID=3988 RepID=B9SI60_RICCO|nr:protein PNS1 [Ricinus communis]EEF36662.1 gd2b, putative [Ricinus communis]|eukprot:XP_002525679.1 protein PNS1 [Ricinus communis]